MSAHEPVVDWTEDRVAVIRALWNEGKSGSQIAGYIGGSATRSSVLGKLYRIGLMGNRRILSGKRPNQFSRHRPTPPRSFSWEQRA